MLKPLTLLALGGAALAGLATIVLPASHQSAQAAVAIPAPNTNTRPTSNRAVAVLAGGCFWGMEGVFQHVNGVNSVTAGYAGGTRATATYEQVGTGRTGHAEAVRIVYNPRQVSYGQLLHIYFSVAHDPTEVNRQGPDVGRDYRSAIFPQSRVQREVARRGIL